MSRSPSDTPDQSGQPQQKRPVTTPAPDVELGVVKEQPKTATIKGEIIDTTEGGITIIVSEDRLRLVLTNHTNGLHSLGWVAPLGIFLSLLTALVTSDFKTEALGLGTDTWHNIFVVATIVAALWLAVAGFMRFTSGGRGKAIDDCVEEIKGTTASGKPQLR